jgi:hypothetical protein
MRAAASKSIRPGRLSQVGVILGRSDGARLAPAADLDVVGLVVALGHVGGRQVGQRGQEATQGLARFALDLALLVQGLLQPLDLGHQPLGLGLVLLGLGLADQLGASLRLAWALLQKRSWHGAQPGVDLEASAAAPDAPFAAQAFSYSSGFSRMARMSCMGRRR